MSEPRHATALIVSRLLPPGKHEHFVELAVLACDGSPTNGRLVLYGGSEVPLRRGTLPPDQRITCERCAVIVDAALEGVKPFPFALPGVPDEILSH